jgi:tetratricopeptide (TPR) repeat protein
VQNKTAMSKILKITLSAVCVVTLSGAAVFWWHNKTKDDIQLSDIDHANINVATGNASINFYHSADYKALEAAVEKAQQRVKNYPDDASFRAELKEAQQNLEDFKRDVLKLAEYFNKIPINTERLRLAKQHFDQGEYQAANAVLKTEELSQDQSALLAKQQQLQQQQAELSQQLENNANEYLLKAQLTAIDYSLGEQRLAKTRELFELALKSARTPENVFAYAYFLSENNQFADAERYYREALNNLRELAKDNAAVYVPDVAMTLNNLGLLVAADSGRRGDAEKLYQEALSIRRELAKDNAAVYVPDVAGTLNNLANLVKADSGRRGEAEKLYQEALSIRRELAKNNAVVYVPDVAGTLNNLANLVAADSGRRGEAEKLYQEALNDCRELAKDNAAVYLPYVATTLNNLANLVAADSGRRGEAEKLYQEALNDYRELAKDNAAVYVPDVANTLMNFGLAYLHWQEPELALKYLQEAAEILAPFAEKAPAMFAKKQVFILQQIEQAKQAQAKQ